jgi:hypothetical protein
MRNQRAGGRTFFEGKVESGTWYPGCGYAERGFKLPDSGRFLKVLSSLQMHLTSEQLTPYLAGPR